MIKIFCNKDIYFLDTTFMDIDTTTSTEQDVVNTDDTSTSVVTETDVSETNQEGNTSGSPTNKGASQQTPAPQTKSVAQTNNSNAFRRLQSTNSRLRNEISGLVKEVQRLQKSDQEADHRQAEKLLDRAETYQTIVSNGEREQWEQEAHQTFGDTAGYFLELSDKYGDYVNNNEPQLCEYIGTKYGMYLLAEWYKRMEVPQHQVEWKQMPGFKKAQVLGNFYEQIEKIITVNASAPVTKQGVPAVSGGRQNTTVTPKDDDVSGNIDAAFKAFGYK